MHVLVLLMLVTPVVDSSDHCIVTKDKKADKTQNKVTSDGMDVPHVDDETSEEREDGNV